MFWFHKNVIYFLFLSTPFKVPSKNETVFAKVNAVGIRRTFWNFNYFFEFLKYSKLLEILTLYYLLERVKLMESTNFNEFWQFLS